MRLGKARPQERSRRILAPLAGIALVAVAIGERLRRARRHTSKRGVHMAETNKDIARRIVEDAFNRGLLDVVGEIVAPSYVLHDPAAGEDVGGPNGLRQFIETYRTAFPDVMITIEEQLAEGDLVATRWSGRGTHNGELLGIAPTGKQVTVTGTTIDKIVDGKLVETWSNWDTLGMLQQLGVVPALAAA